MIVMYILYIRSWHNASSSGTGVLKKTGALIATFQNMPCPSFSFQSLSNSGEESQMQMDIKHAAQPLPQAFVWKSVWQIVVDLRRMFDVSWRRDVELNHTDIVVYPQKGGGEVSYILPPFP